MFPVPALQRKLCALLALLVLFLLAPSAHAYAWMIRHDYGACATCHTDPSGAGLLTPYGRAQADLLLRTRYGAADEEPAKSSGFAFGLLTPPSWLNLGGQFRTLFLETKIGNAKTTPDFFLMQADLQAEARTGGFRANASIGRSPTNGSAAAIAGGLVSREHWLGYGPSDDSFLIRVGRINLPFGIRSIEHTLFVRQATRVDLNDTQEHGVAFAYNGSWFRGEALAIAGNYQVRPDAFRERGYSLLLEATPGTNIAVGVSSLATHAAKDIYLREPNTRQAHGIFARYAPFQELVLLGEEDILIQHTPSLGTLTGSAAMFQADVEPTQGLHFIATAEAYTPGKQGESYGGWLGTAWFFAPHLDARVDAMKRSEVFGPMRIPVTAYMAQLHLFL